MGFTRQHEGTGRTRNMRIHFSCLLLISRNYQLQVPFAIHNLPRSLLVSSTRRIEKSSEKDLPPRGTGDLLMSLCTSARILSISKFVMHDCK
uniref:Uncharacterized protein n=1 Tax=Aegilops tauschii subsp. strangulata TaxID=200361 RepID=A0A453R574_AEGTS